MELLINDPELAPLVQQPDLSLWVGHDRHVMSYPINGGKTFNMVLSHPYDGEIGAWTRDPQKLLEEMKSHYAGWDPR
jgi:salicylate hydroxylase